MWLVALLVDTPMDVFAPTLRLVVFPLLFELLFELLLPLEFCTELVIDAFTLREASAAEASDPATCAAERSDPCAVSAFIAATRNDASLA